MKKTLIILIFEFVLVVSFANADILDKIDYKNITRADVQRINWTYTNLMIDLGQNKSYVNYVAFCRYWGEGAKPGTFGGSDGSVSTDAVIGGRITEYSLKGVRVDGTDITCAPPYNANVSTTGFMIFNDSNDQNKISNWYIECDNTGVCGGDVYSRYGFESTTSGKYSVANDALQGTNTNIRASHSFSWFGAFTNKTLYINNMSGDRGDGYHAEASNPIDVARHNLPFFNGNSQNTWYATIFQVFDNLATINATNNYFEMGRKVLLSAQSQYKITWNGSLVNITATFSCDNRTTWVNITKSGASANCAGIFSSQDLIWGYYLNISADAGNITAKSINITYIQIEQGESAADTAPPALSLYNMTSEGGEGCINWRTDKSNPCPTSDTTPTVTFATDEPAWCAVGSQDINFSDYNDLGIDRNCTTGQGAQSHICSLTLQDEIVYDTSYLFISCKDSSGNQNRTSSSNALKLSITGLEAAGITSIGIGIQNALLSGYANYTDQQIYARNLSNVQVKGTFDRAAKKGSKMWAFNRIGVSDGHMNMFNMTPVLYTLELANKTSTNITKQVELLINATK